MAFRIWDGLWLAFALLPLAIFWSGRNGVFRPEAVTQNNGAPHTETPDDTLSGHLWASALYLASVLLIIAWMRSHRTRGQVLGVVAFAALVGTSYVFQMIGEDAIGRAGVAGLGFDIAIAIIVYLAASFAAWILLWSLADAIRRYRRRSAPRTNPERPPPGQQS